MNLKDIVSISGLSGLFKVEAKRNDGMIVSSLETEKTTFIAVRKHVFTPLDSITVYLKNDDTIELIKVFMSMKEQENEIPVIDSKSDNIDLQTYFKKILPLYDEEKVYFSDIKKILKWYKALNEKNLIDTQLPEVEKAETSQETEPAAKAEAPKESKKESKIVKQKPPKASGAQSVVKKLTNQSKRGG